MIDYNSCFCQWLQTMVSHMSKPPILAPGVVKPWKEMLGYQNLDTVKNSAPNILIKRTHIKEEWYYFGRLMSPGPKPANWVVMSVNLDPKNFLALTIK